MAPSVGPKVWVGANPLLIALASSLLQTVGTTLKTNTTLGTETATQCAYLTC